MSRLTLMTATVLLVLAGCTSSEGGSGGDPRTTAKPSSSSGTAGPKGPDCAGIWKAGGTLPDDYTSCVKGGAQGVQEVTKCDDGTELVAFDDAYFAVTGGRISKPDVAPMQDTQEFGQAFADCTGE